MGRIKALLNGFPESLMQRLAHRLFPLGFALIVTALLAGCQLSAPGKGAGADGDVTPNAVAGDAIEVTALDAPPPAGAAEAAVVPLAGADAVAEPQAASPTAPAEPAPQPEAKPAAQPAPVPAAPVAPKSEAQLDCERRDGTWSPVGSGVLRTCIFQTPDGGKQCDRESQCKGVCLARSRTCSPITPLLGCHEILQDNGARVTLCIE